MHASARMHARRYDVRIGNSSVACGVDKVLMSLSTTIIDTYALSPKP